MDRHRHSQVRAISCVAGPGEYLEGSWTSDSRWRLSARLDPERGALVAAAIDAIVERDGGSAADALLGLAEIGLADAQNPPRQ